MVLLRRFRIEILLRLFRIETLLRLFLMETLLRRLREAPFFQDMLFLVYRTKKKECFSRNGTDLDEEDLE